MIGALYSFIVIYQRNVLYCVHSAQYSLCNYYYTRLSIEHVHKNQLGYTVCCKETILICAITDCCYCAYSQHCEFIWISRCFSISLNSRTHILHWICLQFFVVFVRVRHSESVWLEPKMKRIRMEKNKYIIVRTEERERGVGEEEKEDNMWKCMWFLPLVPKIRHISTALVLCNAIVPICFNVQCSMCVFELNALKRTRFTNCKRMRQRKKV